jgi:CheY-like chemotaxis protein
MSKTVLLIENDVATARAQAEALEGAGFTVRSTGDGKEGLDLAREIQPDAVVLCVELPRMSGYSICQKLKKDDSLKAIPLVLTSSEATAETFEAHRKLKARAEEYLLKPFTPETLLELLGGLVGLPEVAEAEVEPVDEEVVSLEEDLGLQALVAEPEGDLPALDLAALPDEPSAPGGEATGVEDEDLRLLDDAFEGLAAPAPAPEGDGPREGDRPVAAEELEAADASLPAEDEAPPDALGALAAEADRALGSLIDDEGPALQAFGSPAPAPPEVDAGPPLASSPRLEPTPPSPALAGPPPADGAGERRLQAELAEARAALAARDAEIGDLHDQVDRLTHRALEAESASADSAAEAAALKARADSISAQVKRTEADLRAGREELRRAADQARGLEDRARAAEERLRVAEEKGLAAESQVADARRQLEARVAELAAARQEAARVEELERKLQELETEVIVARGEVEGARAEVENRTEELRQRIAELEAANAKNEERVVKAYLKIKGDEKLREKARKAVAIAQQLLEEALPQETSERRGAAAKVE